MTRKETYTQVLESIDTLNKVVFGAVAKRNPLELAEDEKRGLIDAINQLKVVALRMETKGDWK